MKRILLLVLFPYLSSCSLEVKKAVAPSDPPQVEKSVFSASQIRGHFVTDGSPKMFMWPIYKTDEQTNQLVPMSFSEKVKTRQVITAYSEDVELYTQKFTQLEVEINKKYDKLLVDLENEFKQKQCYSFCDPEISLFCDPSDDSVLSVDDWVVGETPEEQAIIAQCQENQTQRENIDDEKEDEIDEKVEPLRQKAGQAALALLQTVGDRNYFTEITSFELFYGPIQCIKNEGCETAEGAEDRTFARIEFGSTVLNNFKNNDEALKLENLSLDASNGFLQFTTPLLDFENDNSVYGEIFYDLEFIETDQGVLRLDGDIRVKDFSTGEERIGRFSSSGSVQKP